MHTGDPFENEYKVTKKWILHNRSPLWYMKYSGILAYEHPAVQDGREYFQLCLPPVTDQN